MRARCADGNCRLCFGTASPLQTMRCRRRVCCLCCIEHDFGVYRSTMSLWLCIRNIASPLAFIWYPTTVPVHRRCSCDVMPACCSCVACLAETHLLSCMQYSQAATLPSKLNNTEHLTQNNGVVVSLSLSENCLASGALATSHS